MNEESSNNAVVIGVVTAILGLAVGFLGASILVKPSDGLNAVAPSTDTKAANLRVTFSGLHKQQVNLLSDAMREHFSGSQNELTAAKNALAENAESIADSFSNIYGDESGNKLLELWNSQTNTFLEYTTALKNNDSADIQSESNNLDLSVEALSNYLAELNSNLPQESLSQLLAENVSLLKASINAYAAGNSAESYTKQSEAVIQVGGIADALAGAVVKQSPDLFK